MVGNTTRKGKSLAAADDLNTIRLADLLPLNGLPKGSKLQTALKLFRSGQTSATIQGEISDFIKGETRADDVVVLRMHGEDFEPIVPHSLSKNLYSSKKVSGMSEAIYKRMPVILERNYTLSWKGILKVQPDFLILVPVTVVGPKALYLIGVTCIAYYGQLSPILDQDSTWHTLLDYIELTVPLLINVHKYEESHSRHYRLNTALEALSRTEKDIHEVRTCIITMAKELKELSNAEYVQVLVVQQEIVEEKKLHRYYNIGSPIIDRDKCPSPHLHQTEEIKISMDNLVGYVAVNGKSARVNNISELVGYGIQTKLIHSIGGCFVNNILCIPISEHSGEAPLIIELSGKPGGFSYQDEEQAQIFARRAAAILSSTLLLDYKKKAIRRHGIRNEVLANIGEISSFKVKQLLDLKFQYSTSFRKKLLDFSFSMRIFPDHQSPGVVLYMFIDLGFATRWKIRKTTLIRFILSMQQGYRDIPYHNWKHACSVSHFAYVLLKKLDLVHNGYLTDLEAFTLFISCLAHDIDHRGRNNHFNLCTKSELYHLYKQEDSIMERHHIAVALSVLNSEDCNLVASLTDEEYREFLELIQWNILATDLAKYMHNRVEYFYTLSHFDKMDKQHRRHLSALIMTTADLCDNVKTWDQNLPCVKSIFHEFFAQGDDEIALGLKPMVMMDRRVAYIPQIEIQFIHNIVRPAYQAITDLLPQTRVCLETLNYFEDLWLVSTAVFDQNLHLEDPLLVLDLKDMKEDNLKRRSAPQLQTILVEHGIPAMSIAQIATKRDSRESFEDTIKNVSEATDGDMNVRALSIQLPTIPKGVGPKVSCCELVKNYLFCCANRNRGLVAARAVRKLRLEMEYLDKRGKHYERRRSNDSVDGPQVLPSRIY